ncbi:MAG TPA: hypothetical protein PKD61_35145, partial [Polyangiaceae bacterium]|nr:hypothetical protein [Polyangiaceae bacterium]
MSASSAIADDGCQADAFDFPRQPIRAGAPASPARQLRQIVRCVDVLCRRESGRGARERASAREQRESGSGWARAWVWARERE